MPASSTPSSKVWQHPFVDVFRTCSLRQWPQGNFAKEGNVKVTMDRTVGHQVVAVLGPIPAANYLQLPKDRADSLGLTGPFLYLQVLLKPGETYAIHADIKTNDKNTTRISVSDLFAPESVKNSQRNIQISYIPSNEGWTVLALDVAALLAPVTSALFEELKTLQFCASLVVRGAFTADDSYALQSLPKDMVLSHAMDPDAVNFVWLPATPTAPSVPFRELSGNIKPVLPSQQVKIKPPRTAPASVSASRRKPSADNVNHELAQSGKPEPWLQLKHINGYTGEFTRVMTWLPNSQELAFAAGNVIVIMHSTTGAQRHLLGCANSICALACSGPIIVSADAGKLGLIRLWDAPSGQCHALLQGHADGINCLDISADGRFLVAVGLTSQCKQQIILWNITGLMEGHQAEVLAKHVSDYNIKAVKFSPYEEGRLMTCGKDSVRIFRLKLGHLRGMSVKVAPAPGEMAKGSWLDTNVFTDIAFETGCGLLQLEERHVYVTSISGAVYQINYGTRTLERVYQLHSAAINCMLVSEGLCITGSDDKYMRVWPLDFSDFLLEAEHEAPVTALGLSPDGLSIAIGTENGVIGCLDVPTHQYHTLLRSHTDTINAVAVDQHRGEYCTVSSDGTIRGWDTATHAQLYELAAPGEIIQCCAFHPDRRELACGFDQGRVRIFDIAESALLQEHKQHRQAVLQVLYLPSGKLLFSLGLDGNLCVYEVAHTYLPVKYLSTTASQLPGCMATSADSSLLATVSRSETSPSASILLFHGTSLEAVRRLESSAAKIASLAFSQDGTQLLASTSDRRLLAYSVATGKLVHEQGEVHKVGADATAIHPSQPLLATGGADRLVKLWHYPQQALSPSAHQSFIGHTDSVTSLAWANANTLISTGAGDAVLIWHVTDAALKSITAVSFGDGQDATTQQIAATQMVDDAVANMTESFDSFYKAEPGLLQQSIEAFTGGAQIQVQQINSSAAKAPEGLNVQTASLTEVHALSSQTKPASVQHAVAEQRVMTVDADSAEPDTAARTSDVKHAQADSAQAIRAQTAGEAEPGLILERVVGFNGDSYGTCVWLADSGVLVYTAEQLLIVEQLATRHQRVLRQHDTSISCLAVTADGSVIASASPPSDATSGPLQATAHICLWDAATARCLHVMHHHSCGVQGLSFSADGIWLLSAGKDPEQNVVIWDVGSGACLTSATTSQPVIALAWRPDTALPAFITVSKAEVLVWELESSHLAQRSLRLPPPLLENPLTALAPHPDGSCFVGDQAGTVWRLQIAPNSSLVTCSKCCSMSNKGQVSCLQTIGSSLLVGGTEGQLVRFVQQPNSSIWVEDRRAALTGAVTSLCSSPAAVQAVVGTSSGTIWYVDVESGSEAPVVTGHSQDITSLALPSALTPAAAPASAQGSPLMATTSADGVLRIWQMPSTSSDWHQVCAVMEFQSPESCTAAAMVSRGGSPCCAAGHEGGCLRLFDLATASLVWTAQAHSCAATVLTVEVSPSPNDRELLSVARDGTVAVYSIQDGGLLGLYQDHLQSAPSQIAAACLSPDKSMLALACAERCSVLCSPWQQKPCTEISCFTCPQDRAAKTKQLSTTTVAFVPGQTDSIMYSSPLMHSSVVEYDYKQSRIVRIFSMQCHPSLMRASLGSDLTAFADAQGGIGMLQCKRGKQTVFKGLHGRCLGMAFTEDYQHLIASSGSSLLVYRTA